MEEIKKQASNIDEEGNVLYLDQERLDRKEVPFPPYKNKPNGLGIYNWLKEHVIYMSDKRWPIARKLYKMFIKYSVWMKEGGKKAEFYKKGIMIANTCILYCNVLKYVVLFAFIAKIQVRAASRKFTRTKKRSF